MFKNGILAEVEVLRLDDLEAKIKKLHGEDRMFTVLNVQYCKRKGDYSHATKSYDTEHYYKVFIMVGKTYKQVRLDEEDREHILRTSRDNKGKIQSEVRSTEKPKSQKEIKDDFAKKLEEAKKRANTYVGYGKKQ